MDLRDRGFLSMPSQKAMAASAALFVGLWGALQLHLFATIGVGRPLARAVVVGILVLALGLFGWGLLLARAEPPLVSEEAIRPHADLLSEIRWRGVLARAVVVSALAPFVDWSMANGFGSRPASYPAALPAIVFFVLLASMVRAVLRTGRGVDDELTASFRAQASRAGFVALLFAAGAAYVVSYDRQWVHIPLTAAMPYALAFGADVVAARFAWLERAAARDG
jgi:hypothetical protein